VIDQSRYIAGRVLATATHMKDGEALAYITDCPYSLKNILAHINSFDKDIVKRVTWCSSKILLKNGVTIRFFTQSHPSGLRGIKLDYVITDELLS
jgi:TusA-related sulfurtransferase